MTECIRRERAGRMRNKQARHTYGMHETGAQNNVVYFAQVPLYERRQIPYTVHETGAPTNKMEEAAGMRFYMKQKVFSWGDKFQIYDEYQNVHFLVEGEVFSWGKKLHLYDRTGSEVAFIRQKVFSFLPRYFISHDGMDVAEVVKEFTFWKQRYQVNGPGWEVSGDFWAHEYEITDGGEVVASVSKRWFTWGDTYEIDIHEGIDPDNEAETAMVLCVVLIIDAVLDSGSGAAASGSAGS